MKTDDDIATAILARLQRLLARLRDGALAPSGASHFESLGLSSGALPDQNGAMPGEKGWRPAKKGDARPKRVTPDEKRVTPIGPA